MCCVLNDVWGSNFESHFCTNSNIDILRLMDSNIVRDGCFNELVSTYNEFFERPRFNDLGLFTSAIINLGISNTLSGIREIVNEDDWDDDEDEIRYNR